MSVGNVIVLVIVGALVVWLVVDTVIWAVKKVKQKKSKNDVKQDSTTNE